MVLVLKYQNLLTVRITLVRKTKSFIFMHFKTFRNFFSSNDFLFLQIGTWCCFIPTEGPPLVYFSDIAFRLLSQFNIFVAPNYFCTIRSTFLQLANILYLILAIWLRGGFLTNIHFFVTNKTIQKLNGQFHVKILDKY